jgi:hypothetical protein
VLQLDSDIFAAETVLDFVKNVGHGFHGLGMTPITA